MNLLDKVKQGMLDGTKAIREISSDVTEMTKLKVNLAKESARMEEMYYELGKTLFYALDDTEAYINFPDEVSMMIGHMRSTLAKMKDCEAKLELLKGIIKCEDCGFILSEEAKFCSNCGLKISVSSIKIPMECTSPIEVTDADKPVLETQDPTTQIPASDQPEE